MILPLTAVVYLLSADPTGYAKPELLVEVGAVIDPRGVEKFHLLDVRSLGKYEAGHIPGAVSAPLTKWSKATAGKTADATYWKVELAAVGVTPKKPVLVYADDVREACRGWWLLAFAGVPDVRLLDGGWGAYTAAGGPGTKESIKTSAEPHDWKPLSERKADKEDVLGMVKEKKGAIIDTRSADEFKEGRVPGATWLEWSELVDSKSQKFKPAAALTKLFRERNLDPTAGGCVYCQSGGRASVVAFGLELMGAKGARNYYRSWSEWGSAADTPKEK
jgi:thiosulfate/3-mercaptopyruvate sulfurtransferase